MQCLRCGTNIGNQLGLCDVCREDAQATRETAEDILDLRLLEQGTPVEEESRGITKLLRVFTAAKEIYALSPKLFIALSLVILIATSAYIDVGWRPLRTYRSSRQAGIAFPAEPNQKAISPVQWTAKENQITALAEYELEGLLLFNIAYRKAFDEFQLSPLDLVVSWGPLSDSSVLQKVKFGHGHRVVYLEAQSPSFNPGLFLSHIHAIPASEKIEHALAALNEDQGVYLKGKLVRVERNGWLPWESSLSRTDSGCEIMWVEEARRID